jgi:hypothetical protein
MDGLAVGAHRAGGNGRIGGRRPSIIERVPGRCGVFTRRIGRGIARRPGTCVMAVNGKFDGQRMNALRSS